MFLWHNVVEPAFARIPVRHHVAWTVIQVIFRGDPPVRRHRLAPLFTWLWHNVVEPVFGGIRRVHLGGMEQLINRCSGRSAGSFRDIVRARVQGRVSAVEA